MIEERIWGGFEILYELTNAQGKQVKTKVLHINKGKNISYQRHFKRDEQWLIADGQGILVVNGNFYVLGAGESFIIPEGAWHSWFSNEDTKIIEVQYGNECSEEDIERMYVEWEAIVEAFDRVAEDKELF